MEQYRNANSYREFNENYYLLYEKATLNILILQLAIL